LAIRGIKRMGKRTIIPFGPQHPVLPEPIHLDLALEDERVIEAIPSIGYVHRGLEKLCEKRDFQDYIYVAERICGICSFMHGMGYATAIENIMKLEIPERAHFLRTVWAELSRIHSHLLWLGLLADAVGFESLFMHSWRMRESILDLFDLTTGGRVIFSVCKVGGVRRDISEDNLKKINDVLGSIESELKIVTSVFLMDTTIKGRMKGLGVLSAEEAHKLGAVGPMARSSGIKADCRTFGYAAYKHLNIQPTTKTEGDCYARCALRIDEIFQSIVIIRQAIELIPKENAIDVPCKGLPEGEYFARLEQPRGEVLYYAKANGTKFLQRFRVRTPTLANLPALLQTFKGVDLADVPVLILTIDPCISCTER
jgi:ech hydrogenase subunit E